MKKMMKIVGLLLLATLLLVACNQASNSPPNTEQPGTSTGGGDN